jgi:hypothetical protein
MPVPFEEAPSPDVPENTPFAWAMDHWRDVPCLDLYTADGDYLDRFLYYETAIPDGLHARMNTVVEDGRQLAGFLSPEGILLETGPEPVARVFRIIPLPADRKTPGSRWKGTGCWKSCATGAGGI